MQNGIKTTGKIDKRDYFEKTCQTACPQEESRYLKGGCDCKQYLDALAEFKRDIVHEWFMEIVMGVGA